MVERIVGGYFLAFDRLVLGCYLILAADFRLELSVPTLSRVELAPRVAVLVIQSLIEPVPPGPPTASLASCLNGS